MAETPWLTRDEQETWIALANIAMRLEGKLDQELRRDGGITFAEYLVLAMLSENPDRTLTLSELAARSNSSASRMSHIVTRLVNRHWVERRPSPHDGRTTLAFLTDAGLETIRQLAPLHVAYVRDLIFDALEPEDLQSMRVGLLKIADALTPVSGRTSVPGPSS
ncbi:MAG: Transcriptional regulator, MarR family [uncultured Propionibacteriaceae bacterium]|uniref:Transcriptional regulator, MarR family n=1 Tax=uncultured Propionibacteriaceae bacterium TaxID=257457 RepID=A0A6J4NZ48_9ACTN|nr:MAG: Transcriptional regulator, MarR family [uncultured Propionibacteriaceae bacterium]